MHYGWLPCLSHTLTQNCTSQFIRPVPNISSHLTEVIKSNFFSLQILQQKLALAVMHKALWMHLINCRRRSNWVCQGKKSVLLFTWCSNSWNQHQFQLTQDGHVITIVDTIAFARVVVVMICRTANQTIWCELSTSLEKLQDFMTEASVWRWDSWSLPFSLSHFHYSAWKENKTHSEKISCWLWNQMVISDNKEPLKFFILEF